jgi:nucleotide-binding universal stress UspA family protein
MKKMLVPTDFSAVADNAVQYAIALGSHLDVQYIFFHAGKTSTSGLQDKINRLHNDPRFGEKQISYIAADVDFSVEKVKELIQKHQTDLIVMGTHGEHSPFPPKIFGSNTAAILEDAGVPVIAVPPEYVYKGVSRLAYAADLIKFKKELVEVVSFAKSVNASVNVFHVTPVFPDIYSDKVNVPEIIETVKKECAFPYITFHTEETEHDNQIKKGIRNYLEEHDTDLLVLFHISRSWLDKIIAPSEAIKEIAHIKVPLMIFPKKV